MKNSKTLIVSLSTMAFVVLSAALLIAYTRTPGTQKKPEKAARTYNAGKVTVAPSVTSKVKGLEISGVSLINQGTPQATLAIEVTNRRSEAVMAIDFIAGESTYSGLRMDGLLKPEDPLVIIPPNTLKTFNWELNSILEDETIILVAAIFSDGKEEGDSRFVEGIKRARADFQKKTRTEKDKKGGLQ